MTEWQPMETAPRDGTHVLVYSESHGIQKSHYDDFFKRWMIYQTAEYDNEFGELEGVTHWQPLPEPPK